MPDYLIAASSTADLPRTWLEEHRIPFIPYSCTVADRVYEDDCREESREAVYAGMRRGDRLEDPTGLRIHILQADCRADAEFLRDGILQAYPQVGKITITGLGVVIGAHCGPGLLTVFCLCTGRNPE